MRKLAIKFFALAVFSLFLVSTSRQASAVANGGTCFYNCGFFESCQSCGTTCTTGKPYCNSGGCGCN